MISVINDNENWTIKFDNNEISKEFLMMLLKKSQIEQYLQNSQLNEELAFSLSEEIKENWWNENKERILKKAGINDEYYS